MKETVSTVEIHFAPKDDVILLYQNKFQPNYNQPNYDLYFASTQKTILLERHLAHIMDSITFVRSNRPYCLLAVVPICSSSHKCLQVGYGVKTMRALGARKLPNGNQMCTVVIVDSIDSATVHEEMGAQKGTPFVVSFLNRNNQTMRVVSRVCCLYGLELNRHGILFAPLAVSLVLFLLFLLFLFLLFLLLFLLFLLFLL
jgi:hypothetical protein